MHSYNTKISILEEDLEVLRNLETLLNQLRIDITSNIEYLKVKKNLGKLIDFKFENEKIILPLNPNEIREIVLLLKLSESIIKIQENSQFEKLVPHLRLLKKCYFFGRPLTDSKNTIWEENTNKMFELFIATGLLEIGFDLDIAKPTGNNGERPDIYIRIDDIRYGIECKVINSNIFKPYSFLKLIKKGTKQILKSEKIHLGFVFANIINILPHDLLLPFDTTDSKQYCYCTVNEETIQTEIKSFLDSTNVSIKSYMEKHSMELKGIFISRKLIRMWLFYIVTVAFVKESDKVAVYFYQNIEATNIIDESNLDSEEDFKDFHRNKTLMEKINKSLH